MKEYLDAIRDRYIHGDRKEKSRLLDEALQVTSLHRKALIRALRTPPRLTAGGKAGRPKRYGLEAATALKTLWEASDRVCAKRLQPFLPELLGALERHGELVLEQEVRDQVCAISAATIDRLLRTYRLPELRRPFSTTRPGTLLKAAIPIRTFTEWNEHQPCFLEIDLVAHCGESTEGQYLNTLSAVDIATGWVACRGVLGKGQQRVGGAIHHIGQNLSFSQRVIDSDNGSEFINHHLYAFCHQKGITFTPPDPTGRMSMSASSRRTGR
ncbi:MAG: hypothetical protein OXE17_05600 [Chloroflexi bacterium]|nr:hypothetical protein [Chloroflexota bacterium]